MDKRCTVCNHSQTHDINLALLGGATLDSLKQQFGLSRSALHRHKQHLQRSIDQAEDRLRNNFLMGYLFQLNDYNCAAAATVAAARAEGNARLTLQAANAGTRIITSMAKFEVDLDHETSYRLMTSPKYVQSGNLLPDDPQILAGLRQNLVRSLKDACPEIPDPLLDPEDVEENLKSSTPDPAQARQLKQADSLNPLNAARDSQEVAEPSSLTLNVNLHSELRTQNSEPSSPDPYSIRDGCGTAAGQIPLISEIIEENQSHIQEEQEAKPKSFLSSNGKRSFKGTFMQQGWRNTGRTPAISELIQQIQRYKQQEKEAAQRSLPSSFDAEYDAYLAEADASPESQFLR